eukprot:TRINITY_DN10429_c0_g1_i1.p1 TRINITY_DN10429_c0_g1~~TRINITY_DN10429_c0_g1_i1.p1  ORF type:complete len:580 (+),score=121.96 TRINITY_DN10429_c0_g1_i1:22-1761(+)
MADMSVQYQTTSQPLLPTTIQPEPQQRCGWMKVLVGLLACAVLIAVLALSIDSNIKLKDQRDDMSALMSSMKNGMRHEVSSKFKISHVGPRKYQFSRGTCWGFGTIAAVEYQYRKQGIEQGWLKDDEYMFFSEQAYGNRMIELCQQHRMQCLLPGDKIAFNSTNGGEAHLLYVFRQQLADSLLPVSVCPYIQDQDDSSCPGIDGPDGFVAKNPLRWRMNSFSTFYDNAEIKRQLALKNRAMAISVPIFTASYYIQCSDAVMKGDPACFVDGGQVLRDDCAICPIGFKDKCCKEIEQPMWNMNGEFLKHHAMNPEAGHVMMLSGYNDQYETELHQKGGFIMRNTWKDGVYFLDEFGNVRNRGSHSLQFFMGEISSADERAVCPNSDNPRNWYSCPICDNCTPDQTTKACAIQDTVDTADAGYQPFYLTCRAGQKECSDAAYMRYFTNSWTHYGDDLVIMCFTEFDTRTTPPTGLRSFCLNPRPFDSYALVFKPVHSWPMSEDHCGFYFFPYDLASECNAKLGGFFVNDYEITFDSQSYAANAANSPARDYTHVKNSTAVQPAFPKFETPYPNPPVSNSWF